MKTGRSTETLSEIRVLSDVEVFQSLKRYYQNFIDEGIIEILKDDVNTFVWKEKKSGNKIAISRKEFISIYNVMKPWLMHGLRLIFKEYNYKSDNSKMRYFKDKGFYINNTAEFLFQYKFIESEYPNQPMSKFNIDDVEFEIGKPSDMFKVMFHHISDDDDFEWENIFTIKLKYVKNDIKNGKHNNEEEIEHKLEKYLQYAMYIIHRCAPSDLVGDYPQVYQYMYTHDYFTEPEEIIESEINDKFRVGEYTEPMAFFNEGKRKRDFLSFYRVIEYFYIINRKSEFEQYIEIYNKKINNARAKVKDKELDTLLKNFTSIYKDQEINLLEKLIEKIAHVDLILEFAHSNGIIQNQGDKKEFAKELYKHRNSRVHGKSDTNFKLIVPTILNLDEKKKSDDKNTLDHSNEWDIIIETLAEFVLLQF
ncbi:hypothetical protein QRY07_12060 [Bacillus cereus]|uniref:hypothetical protein n=1 Tax=Bacillus cereus TaxID=1396 RepID=UPI002570570C|nr:hypothetical protein [Bacillus cereus]WJE22420.1 hypothetical protein QRY07_12060 [Bacillus cereus]